MTVISEIDSAIQAIENDSALHKETNFDIRADAIDFIDFHIAGRIDALPGNDELYKLKARAEKLGHDFEKIDAELFNRLRENIKGGLYKKDSFSEMVEAHMGSIVNGESMVGYDNLDLFIDGLLSGPPIPEPTKERKPEMVFYQKTPARIIFELCGAAQIKAGDVFFDIGSGLGQTAILVNLISGAMAKGIEYEPAYSNYAKTCAEQLNLNGIEFINKDALKADYSAGTVFFLYTPFEGSMLLHMLKILRQESLKKQIAIFTYGPCSLIVSQQDWLTCEGGDGSDVYKLYRFKNKA